MTQGERITKIEADVDHMKSKLDSVGHKLDDLLALRNRGIGAFWLASALFGSSIVGLFGYLFGWFHK